MADDLHDSYRILQLEPGAPLPKVKRAYRHLVKMWHPDHFAPGSKMELKAQEKLKEINLAYERLCKSRGQASAGAADPAGQGKKDRKSAAPSDEETKSPRRSSSRKAGEDPAPAAKGSSRKLGEIDDEAPDKPASSAPEGDAERTPPPAPARRRFTFSAGARTRRRLVLGAAAAVAAALVAAFLPRGFWAARVASWRSPSPAPAAPAAAPAGESPALTAAAAAPVPPPAKPALGSGSTPTATPPVAPAAGTPAAAPASPAGTSAAPAAPAAVVAGAPAVFSSSVAAFTVGSSKEEVIEVQGKPDRFTATEFQYGSSEVFFQNGRVESWRDGNPRLKARKPADLSALSVATFSIGSRRDEVLAVQGQPDAVTDTTFRYGSSVVVFRNDRVESWHDGNPHLKTRELSSETVAKLATFTVGSRKDEVVEVQGLPEKFTETTFQYGSSTVFFENGRVVSWINGDPPLKAAKP